MESKKGDLHFSHDHSLDYTKLQPRVDATCSSCTHPISPGKFYYKCKLCGFYLHQVCFNMPENVTHPSDPTHNLTLETFPKPSKLPISCKACQNPINGYYYQCSKCTAYYHTLCLAAPLSMKTPLHRHSLNIEFVPVYDFQCDLCDKPSYSGWVYHCNLCEFDAHLSCVLSNKGNVEPHATVPGYVKGNERQDELMELLTKGSNLQPDQDQSNSLSNDQDLVMQSFQLSEACFSIDFQNSLIGNDGEKMRPDREAVVREATIPEESRMYGTTDEGFDDSRRSERGRVSSYSRRSTSSGIGGHIWTELEQATEKRNSKNGQMMVGSDPGRPSSSFPKFMCCFNMGKISY